MLVDPQIVHQSSANFVDDFFVSDFCAIFAGSNPLDCYDNLKRSVLLLLVEEKMSTSVAIQFTLFIIPLTAPENCMSTPETI